MDLPSEIFVTHVKSWSDHKRLTTDVIFIVTLYTL